MFNISVRKYNSTRKLIAKEDITSMAPVMDHHGWDKDDLLHDFIEYCSKDYRSYGQRWLNDEGSFKAAWSWYCKTTYNYLSTNIRSFKVDNGFTQLHDLNNTSSTYTMHDYVKSPFPGPEEMLLHKEHLEFIKDTVGSKDWARVEAKLAGEANPNWNRINKRVVSTLAAARGE